MAPTAHDPVRFHPLPVLVISFLVVSFIIQYLLPLRKRPGLFTWSDTLILKMPAYLTNALYAEKLASAIPLGVKARTANVSASFKMTHL